MRKPSGPVTFPFSKKPCVKMRSVLPTQPVKLIILKTPPNPPVEIDHLPHRVKLKCTLRFVTKRVDAQDHEPDPHIQFEIGKSIGWGL